MCVHTTGNLAYVSLLHLTHTFPTRQDYSYLAITYVGSMKLCKLTQHHLLCNIMLSFHLDFLIDLGLFLICLWQSFDTVWACECPHCSGGCCWRLIQPSRALSIASRGCVIHTFNLTRPLRIVQLRRVHIRPALGTALQRMNRWSDTNVTGKKIHHTCSSTAVFCLKFRQSQPDVYTMSFLTIHQWLYIVNVDQSHNKIYHATSVRRTYIVLYCGY